MKVLLFLITLFIFIGCREDYESKYYREREEKESLERKNEQLEREKEEIEAEKDERIQELEEENEELEQERDEE